MNQSWVWTVHHLDPFPYCMSFNQQPNKFRWSSKMGRFATRNIHSIVMCKKSVLKKIAPTYPTSKHDIPSMAMWHSHGILAHKAWKIGVFDSEFFDPGI